MKQLAISSRCATLGLIILISFLLARPLEAGSRAGSLIAEADRCRSELESSKEKMKYRRYWMRCISRYQEVVRLFPATDEAAWALYRLGNLYTGLYGYSGSTQDLDRAVEHLSAIVSSHASHSLADDAQYMIAEIYFRYKNDLVGAYRAFLAVEIAYPGGDMAPKARRMMEEVAMALGEKEALRMPAEAPNTQIERAGSSATLLDIRYWSSPSYTRVVVDVDGPVKYRHEALKADPDANKPKRIYVDLENTHIRKDIEREIPIKDGLLQRARAALNTPDTVRVVLDLDDMKDYKIFHLFDPFRIVLDVQRPDEASRRPSVPGKTLARRAPKKGVAISKAPDQRPSLARQLGLGIKRVVIDPGHGGKDPGCYVGGGLYEKDVVLRAAKVLANKLQDRFGFEVFLTRNRDIFLSLEQRTAIANIRKADLVISIHVNAHKDSRVNGIETYFLNMATDEGAIKVAARENSSTEKNLSDLQLIIRDLMLNNKINESSKLAHEVQSSVVSRLRGQYAEVKDLGVKQAPFYVLTGASMPSILLEMGFITNQKERARLSSRDYYEHIAEGICNAVEKYTKRISEALALSRSDGSALPAGRLRTS